MILSFAEKTILKNPKSRKKRYTQNIKTNFIVVLVNMIACGKESAFGNKRNSSLNSLHAKMSGMENQLNIWITCLHFSFEAENKL